MTPFCIMDTLRSDHLETLSYCDLYDDAVTTSMLDIIYVNGFSVQFSNDQTQKILSNIYFLLRWASLL